MQREDDIGMHSMQHHTEAIRQLLNCCLRMEQIMQREDYLVNFFAIVSCLRIGQR
jgi:hypothetical protein